MIIFITGFIASVAHVVTGPDHLAAVTPLAIDSHKKSWIIGLLWGVGHTLGILFIGSLFLLFKEALPIGAISKHSDTIVGFLLIGIGSWALLKIYLHHSHGNRQHSHFHTRPFLYAHIHRHTHENGPSHEHRHVGSIKQNAIAALFIGIVHGFAGFSHLFALLPSLSLPSIWLSVIYIISFASGTIVAMVIFAFILGLAAFRSVVKDKQIFLKWFTIMGGALAIAVGVIWIWTAV